MLSSYRSIDPFPACVSIHVQAGSVGGLLVLLYFAMLMLYVPAG